MKTHFATVILGLLFAGPIDGLPTSFLQSHLSQHIFGGTWYKTKESASYQTCKRDDTPGVGFEFTATYATASVKYKNGTIVDIGKVDGDYNYQNAMLELFQGDPALGYGKPPFSNPVYKLKYTYYLALRKSRKLLGLSSTAEIGVLASILSTLKNKTEDYLNYPISSALVAIPELPFLEDGDFEEAFTYAGLTKPSSDVYEPKNLDWVNAAYAGMGYGLCGDWEHETTCGLELESMKSNQTLVVSFDGDALRIRNDMMSDALHGEPADLFTDYTLAWTNKGAEGFWQKMVRMIVRSGMNEDVHPGRKIRNIVITGEYADDKKFLDSLWQALQQLGDEGWLFERAADVYSQLQVPGFNALYLGARGAAELALRWKGEVEYCYEVDVPLVEEPISQAQESEAPVTADSKMGPMEVGAMAISSKGFAISVSICIATGASSAGGGLVRIMSDDAMKTWGLDLEALKEGVKKVQEEAGGRAWNVQAGLGSLDPLYVANFF